MMCLVRCADYLSTICPVTQHLDWGVRAVSLSLSLSYLHEMRQARAVNKPTISRPNTFLSTCYIKKAVLS